jgi:hypothetical protein
MSEGASPAEGGASRAERDAARRRRAETAVPGPGGGRSRPRRPGVAYRPPAPWGRFPLTELVVLVGIALAVLGLVVGVESERGRTMLFAGIALGSLAGLETSVRDHFAGYRSHTTLLAGAAGATSMIGTIFALKGIAPGIPLFVPLIVGAVVFAIVFPLLRRVFQRRSGGLSYR